MVRRYPHNSPEAAARIVAFFLIADGHASASEFNVLNELDAEQELGLEPRFLPHIAYTLCEELRATGCDTSSHMGVLTDGVLALLMSDISDVALQRKVLRLALAAARADRQLADGEHRVLQAARRHWQLVDGGEPSAKAFGNDLAVRPGSSRTPLTA